MKRTPQKDNVLCLYFCFQNMNLSSAKQKKDKSNVNKILVEL